MGDVLQAIDVGLVMPLILILNYSLFQYLLTMFWKRRHEHRVRLLLLIAFLGFTSLVPFAVADHEMSRNLNGISEVCTVLTFLVQITILTRDVGKRIKIRSVWMLMWIGEALSLIGLAMLVTNFLDLIAPFIDMNVVILIDKTVEYISLVFVVGFRFYFLAVAKGYHKVLATQKNEIVSYTLLLTHALPFYILTALTGWSWDHVKGIWLRLMVAACLWCTIKARLPSKSSKVALATTNGPKASHFDGTSGVAKVSEVPSKTAASKHAASSTPVCRSMTATVPQPGPTSVTENKTTSPSLDLIEENK